MLSIVCIQTNNYQGCGPEYVARLRAQVRRNVKTKHRFYCVTDDAASEYPGVRCKPAVHRGWWEKIRLFKPGMFQEGRVVFLDLDTIIVGNIDDIVAYDGDFATLHDFWRPMGLGPAVMLWRSGFGEWIYQEWEAAGFPQDDPRGDQAWLENLNQGRMRKEVDILQDLFPGRFVSYKSSCTEEVPAGASVVCFHGKPRPHEVGGWVKSYWS